MIVMLDLLVAEAASLQTLEGMVKEDVAASTMVDAGSKRRDF